MRRKEATESVHKVIHIEFSLYMLAFNEKVIIDVTYVKNGSAPSSKMSKYLRYT